MSEHQEPHADAGGLHRMGGMGGGKEQDAQGQTLPIVQALRHLGAEEDAEASRMRERMWVAIVTMSPGLWATFVATLVNSR